MNTFPTIEIMAKACGLEECMLTVTVGTDRTDVIVKHGQTVSVPFSVATEDKVVEELIKTAVRSLRRELADAREQIDAERYQRRIAEWALVGVLRSDRRISYMLPAHATHGANEAADLVDHLSRHTARSFLQDTGMAFREHGMMYEAENFIRYLENHATRFGLSFRSWEETKAEHIKGRPCSFGKVPFVGPNES